MTKNATNDILMVRPVRFGMNAQTAVDNFYQNQQASKGAEDQIAARAEFDAFVEKLRGVGVNVHVLEDTETPHTPDSIFPNNWISMHEDGTVVLYPMKAENRRLERRSDIFEHLKNWGFDVNVIHDISDAEVEKTYLEGTGSIVFDHDSRIAYLAESQRAESGLFKILCDEIGYTPFVFKSFQQTPDGTQPIYHTNVMMCVTNTYVLICLDTIHDLKERAAVVAAIHGSGKEVLEISEDQKVQFAGNMLLVKGGENVLHLVMSGSAFRSLTEAQKHRIQRDHQIIYSDLPTIETLGGGSARCMLAEIYLPKNNE